MVSLHAALAVVALSSGGETVLLDFYSDSCPPCRAMMPTVDELATRYPVRKVNVMHEPKLAAQHGVQNIPCFVMLVDGTEVAREVGGTTYSRLLRMCQMGTEQAPPAELPPVGQTEPERAPSPPPMLPPESTPAPFTPQTPPTGQLVRPEVPQQQTRPPQLTPDWRGTEPSGAPGWSAKADAATGSDAGLLAASVRLRITDAKGHSCGSGTIIDARDGQALILTCGHIFRDSQGQGQIEVDLFCSGAMQTVAGRLISCHYDQGQPDLGLVAIAVPAAVATAHVAPPGYRIACGDPVATVGCNNGDRPSVLHTRVTALDKYLGPPNVEVAGQSVEGRSGGGVFSSEGEVIAVCNSADPADDESLCAALKAIHAELDRCKLSFVYRPQLPGEPASVSPSQEIAAVDPPPMPEQMPRPGQMTAPGATTRNGVPALQASHAAPAAGQLTATEQAALAEIRRHLQDGAEVVCVVRSRQDPTAKSQIIMLDQVSPLFLERLAAQARGLDASRLVPTDLNVPRTR